MSSAPAQRIPKHLQDLSFTTVAFALPPWPTFLPRCSAWKDGEGLDRQWKEQLSWAFALTPSGSRRCLHGAAGGVEKPSRQVLSLQGLDAATHSLPPAPQLHAHQPRLPEDKGLYCLHPLPGPSPSSLAGWRSLPEEGRTHFLLLVLTPLPFQSWGPSHTPTLESVEKPPHFHLGGD